MRECGVWNWQHIAKVEEERLFLLSCPLVHNPPLSWQYRDLDQTAQVAFTVWEVREGRPLRALAGTTLRLFSKKGRLKTGSQMLRLWLPGPADHAWPSQTPGKVPVSQRGEQGCAAVWWGQGGAV